MRRFLSFYHVLGVFFFWGGGGLLFIYLFLLSYDVFRPEMLMSISSTIFFKS